MTSFESGPQRLQKLIAAAGMGSRRTVEQWIHEGRVTVNGKAAKLGDRASPGDEVCLDGRPLTLAAAEATPRRVLLYHKPVGEVTTRSDPQRRPTVFENLPKLHCGRWIAVGRLDVMTSGLLLFTTDGALAHRLMHPSSEVEREYWVRVQGTPSAETLARLREGVLLEDGPARLDRIQADAADDSPAGGRSDMVATAGAGNTSPTPARRGDSPASMSFKVALHEGRNREVRRIWSAVGHEVLKLARLRYGPIALPPDLAAGRWREAQQQAIDLLDRASAAPSRAGPL
jgi:23S rRNA pseudouridine2605 synthase